MIHSDEAPKAIGPYSQAIVCANGSGNGGMVFCSGQTPIDPATGKLVDGDVKDQAHRVMKNLGAVLAKAGASFGNVVKATIYLKDLGHFAEVNAVYESYLTPPYPARVTVEVARLPMDCLVEIDAIAQLG